VTPTQAWFNDGQTVSVFSTSINGLLVYSTILWLRMFFWGLMIQMCKLS